MAWWRSGIFPKPLFGFVAGEQRRGVSISVITVRPRDQDGSIARVKVWIFSDDVQPEHWRTAKPEHYLNESLRDAKLASLNTSQPAVQPGKYWAKAVWDRSPYCDYGAYGYRGRLRDIDPNDVTPSAQKGDFESDPIAVFEVKAGETTTVKLQCIRPVVSDSINGSP